MTSSRTVDFSPDYLRGAVNSYYRLFLKADYSSMADSIVAGLLKS